MLAWWTAWRAARDRRRRLSVYLDQVLRAPTPGQLDWLSTCAEPARAAERELLFLRRALGLLVAEQDTLDDRTLSEVAHHLAPVLQSESRSEPAIGQLWVERWHQYRQTVAVRGVAEMPAARMARVLLSAAGIPAPTGEQLRTAMQVVTDTRLQLNTTLRHAFGGRDLPIDVRPSAMQQ